MRPKAKCPLCGAGKDAFVLKEDTPKTEAILEKPHTEKELSPMEMSIICSNLNCPRSSLKRIK